nr:DUF2953 domain-containing protein [Clostridium ganghwense]
MIYGLDDAAKTAISYGILSSISFFLYNLLCSFFHVRELKINPQTNFEKSMLELKIQSIIIINLVKIIYISLLVFLTLKGNSKKSLNSKEAM